MRIDAEGAWAHAELYLDDSNWPRVVCLGEALIDFVAVDSELGLSSTFIRAPGGAPANVAVALTRLGTPAAFVGKLSADLFGCFLRDTLANEGVNLSGVAEDHGARTPLAFVGSDGKGGRAFVFYHDGMADTRLDLGDVAAARALIAHAKVFHFGSVTLCREPSSTATVDAAKWARANGCLVSFDPNVRVEVWSSQERARSEILKALALADVVKVSNDELQFLAGTTDPAEACRTLREYGPRLVVVTLGADGCYYDAGSACGWVAGVPVTVVDTLGAGDAFVGGLLAGLASAEGIAPEDNGTLIPILRFANAVGAAATTRYGAIPALPTRQEAEALL